MTYQRSFPDADILSHQRLTKKREDGGMRPRDAINLHSFTIIAHMSKVGQVPVSLCPGVNDATLVPSHSELNLHQSHPPTMLSRVVQTLSLYFVAAHASSIITDAQESWSIPNSFTDGLRVPVILGVMSRCPDALLCETLFDKVIPKVAEKIEVSLAYVARYGHNTELRPYLILYPDQPCTDSFRIRLNSSDLEFGVTCRHGRDECAGNVQQLCAAKYTPMRTWWEFVTCQNYEGKDRIGRPDVALKCARTAKIDWDGSEVGRCAGMDGSGTGKEGVRLLQENVKSTKALGIMYVAHFSPPIDRFSYIQLHSKSCTIMINGEKVCVHDEMWKNCEVSSPPNLLWNTS